MIIDSHVYCFEPADQPAGYRSSAEHRWWIQEAQALHFQPAWRIRDRTPGSSKVLIPDEYTTSSELPDVQFRFDRERGRVVWTVDGEDYTKHFYPPNLRNLEFTPHSVIAEMDHAGVDIAMIHSYPMLTKSAEFLAECVRLYPDRLRAMAPVDEWRILPEPDAVIAELDAVLRTHKLHAIKFNARSAYLDSNEPWDSEGYQSFWDAAASYGLPIFFTLGSGPRTTARDSSAAAVIDGYLEEQRTLMRWMERYPDVTVNLTHGFPWREFVDDDHFVELPEAIWAPFQNPRCHLEVCFPIRIGDLFDFPYREVWPVLERMVERVGVDRLNWGTDMPFENRFCTYRQSRDWIEKYCAFLSKDDLAMLMGGTSARILNIEE